MVRDDTMVYLGIYINVRLQALHPYICNNILIFSLQEQEFSRAPLQ